MRQDNLNNSSSEQNEIITPTWNENTSTQNHSIRSFNMGNCVKRTSTITRVVYNMEFATIIVETNSSSYSSMMYVYVLA